MTIAISRLFPKLVLGLLLSFVGCASAPSTPPKLAISTAETSIRKANTVGAAQFTPLELEIAIKKLEAANQALANGETEKARRLAEQAQVDGELAEALARTAQAHQDLGETRKMILNGAPDEEGSPRPASEREHRFSQ